MIVVPAQDIAPNVAHVVWPWAALLLLGALHGINPGMGWLFAVALGMQRQERRAVWRALLPLAGGHAAAIAVAAIVVGIAGLAVSLGNLRWVVAVVLLGAGVSKLVRNRHPRWGGMAVGGWQLAVWSFLMASAHGAGLMAVPFLLSLTPTPVTTASAHVHTMHAASQGATGVMAGGGHATHATVALGSLPHIPVVGAGVAIVHTIGYLAITGLIAVIVYERLGLRLLAKAWFNVDRLWAGALIATAAVTPLLR